MRSPPVPPHVTCDRSCRSLGLLPHAPLSLGRWRHRDSIRARALSWSIEAVLASGATVTVSVGVLKTKTLVVLSTLVNPPKTNKNTVHESAGVPA